MICARGGVQREALDFWPDEKKRQTKIQSAQSIIRGFNRIIAARDARLAREQEQGK